MRVINEKSKYCKGTKCFYYRYHGKKQVRHSTSLPVYKCVAERGECYVSGKENKLNMLSRGI